MWDCREGRVSSVNAERHTVQVTFDDVDPPFVTGDLKMLATRNGDHALPSADALVACIISDDPERQGYCLGVVYSDADPPALDEADERVVASDTLRLGSKTANKAVALAPDVKTETQKVLDYAQGIATAIIGGVVVAQDGGASLKASIVAALPVLPTLDEPGADKVKAE